MKKQPLHIIVTGPESSGKTTLTLQLAHKLNAPWNAEVARTFLEAINRPYTQDDILTIATLQLFNLNTAKKQGAPIHIFDTSFLVLKIWLQEKYNTTITLIEEQLQQSSNDLYVLCKPDIPWEPDPLRENEHDRDRLFAIYEKELKEMEKRYIVVGGDPDERVEMVLKYFNDLVKGD